MKILHCLTGAAGQPFIISRAQRKLGYEADCVLLGKSKFGYQADYEIHLGKNNRFETLADFLADVAPKYDVFHFYGRPFFLMDSRTFSFPAFMDLLLLRALGKTIIFHYRGSEIRIASLFKKLSPFNYVEENPDRIFSKYPEHNIRHQKNFVKAAANAVLVPDIELQSYLPEADIIPRAINLDEWKFVGQVNKEKPLIVHAPSRRNVKGTSYILKAIKELKKEGLSFQFKLIENLSNEEARQEYEKADIVIDQLRIGWYGVLAVEAMALGKIVIANIREDLLDKLAPQFPIINSSPNNIKEQIRQTLSRPLEERITLAESSRKYCEKHHDSNKIAHQLIELYQRSENTTPDISNIFSSIKTQVNNKRWSYQAQELMLRLGDKGRGLLNRLKKCFKL